jgi:hypothetical protein
LLALPRVTQLTRLQQVVIWVVAALLGLWMVLRVPRTQAISRALLLILLVLIAMLLVFQMQLIWLPPTMPMALLAASAVVTRVVGRRAVG